ncbi:hypothetical protein BGZ75_006457, partial [Mortierella antarctica]
VNEEVTLMDWGNAFIRSIEKNAEVIVTGVQAELHLEGDFKKTKRKLTWLADGAELVKVELLDYDYLNTKKKVEEDDELKDLLTPKTEFKSEGIADGNVAELNKGDIIQLERKGYYIVDSLVINIPRISRTVKQRRPILLSSALGAALALYSKSHQGYAHSIRWVRQSGYVEMFKAISTSRGKLPEAIIKSLSTVVLLSILISIADTGAKVFVKQAVRQTNDALQIIESTPFIKADTFAKMEGWTTTISTPDGPNCYTADLHRNILVPTQSGLSYSPITLVIKCLYPTGQVIALSSTSIIFSVSILQSFHNVTSLIFEQKDDPLANMERSISKGLFSRLAATLSDGIHVIEVQTTGTEVRALTCAAKRASQNGTTYLMCSYTTASAILTMPQVMLPEISARRRAGKPYAPYDFYTEAATYFAALGQNIYVDWRGSKILLIFETANRQKGYEIPIWLFAVVIGLMASCVLLIAWVKVSTETKFKRSLRWMVSKALEPRLDARRQR